jgi:hypothetical protein
LNFHLSANHISSVIVSVSLFTSSHREYTLNFQFFITTVSLSSKVVNSFATFHKAFISLDRKIHFFHTQIIIGLPSFAHTRISGFSLSITAIEYAQIIFLVICSRVVIIFQSKESSINFAITSVSVSQ